LEVDERYAHEYLSYGRLYGLFWDRYGIGVSMTYEFGCGLGFHDEGSSSCSRNSLRPCKRNSLRPTYTRTVGVISFYSERYV
jgi:hypothetical protein